MRDIGAPTLGTQVLVGTLPTTFRLLAETVDGAFSMVEQTVEPGVLVWPHVHTMHDQVAVILSGQLGVRVGDREWTAQPGEVVARPRHIPHTVWNDTTAAARFIEITTPGDFEHYFHRISELGPDDEARRAALQEEFGITGVEGWIDSLSLRYGVTL